VTEPPERPLDIQELFAALARHGVAYLVIGGVAVQVHGHRRTTKDLDVAPAPGADNAVRLAAALAELEARPADGAPGWVPDPEQLAIAAIVPALLTMHGQLHIVPEPRGGNDWDAMRKRALVVDLEEIAVPIAALDDLIRMKLATGRPGDLDDVAVLAAIDRGR